MDEFLKLLTESPDNEALAKMLTQGMQGAVKSDDIGGNLLKTGLSTAGTAVFGPIGGVAGTVLGQLLVPNKQEPQPINPRVQRNLNPYGMATGGMVQDGQGLVPVEVEGDEMYELPNGQVGEFQGPDHEQGGIPTQLPLGTNVYSKRMAGADGRSMADRKESRERRLRKILAQLDKRPTDAPTINSVSREVNRIQAEEEQDMQIMQMYQLRDMLAQARQGQMQGQMSPEMMQQQQMQQGQMSPEMMQGQMPQEMMQGEMPMMRGGGKVDPRLGTGRDMANINKVAPEVAPNQIDLIHQYHKGKGDVYQILDKAGGKRTFYRDGEELFTHPVLVGANEGDDPTMTLLNEGGVDWEAGNKMTGAGVFEVSKAQKRNSNYQNAPFYVYKNVATGKNIRSSDHAVLGSRRSRLQDDDFTNNRMTNGCVNANCDDLKEVYNAGYGVGNRRYVLPEDGYNYFDMEDGEIVMKTRYTGGDLPEVTVTAERPSVIGMSPQLVEMSRESTAVNMPMMQAGGVIRNGNTMNGFTDLAMLLGGYNKMAAGGTTPMMSDDYINQFANYQLPVMEAGGEVQGDPSLREVLRKILQFESNHGSASGTSLPNFGKKGDAVKFENEEEALDWMMENIVPQIPEGLSTVEQLAWADFLYNTGKDPRVWAVQEYLQKYDPDSEELENGELKGRKDMFIAMKDGTYEGSEDEERINKLYEDVMALNGKERLKLFNEGRDFYYRNITMEDEEPVKDHPLGAKSNAYQNTWFQRMKNSSTLDPYSEEVYVPYSKDTAQVFNVENLDKLVETTYNPPQQDAAPDATENQTATTTEASGPSFFEERLRLNQDLFEGRRNPSDYEIPFAPAADQTAPNSQVDAASDDLDTLVELEAANPGLSVDDLITDLSAIPPITNQQDQGFSGYGIDGNLMPQTELATGIPSSEVVTDFLPNTQDAIRDEVLAQLDEYNNAEFYIRNVGNEKINKEDDESVKRAQRALQNKGYDVGPDGADGDWGPNTQKAYDQYIKDKEPDLNELAQQKELLATTINAFVKGSPETTYQLESTSKTPPVDIDALLAESRTEPLPKTPEEKTEPTWKIDPLTRAGYITSGAGPLITTILNRLGDEPTPNFYANFGRDAERALDAAERGIAGSRDRAYEENRLAQNLRGRQARNAARSSNVMQAMQQAALTSGMKANEQITGQYQNALRALLANRAQFEQGQDQAVMKGREAAYTADLQNKDQFSTNLASNLANVGSMMQTLGRQKEIFDVYNQMGNSGGDATKNTLLGQLMSLYSIGGENKKDTKK